MSTDPSALVSTPDGIRHYAVYAFSAPAHIAFSPVTGGIPLYVTQCELFDMYDAVLGFQDVPYPTQRFTADALSYGFSTCVRCAAGWTAG